MAPSAAPRHTYVVDGLAHEEQRDDSRPTKRLRIHEAERDELAVSLPSHPLGIKPSGNSFAASKNHKDAAGTFTGLPDELIIQLLEFLPASSLIQLGSTCKALFAFTRAEELWKALFIE